jgi:beta-N-acetylhexosaminidase
VRYEQQSPIYQSLTDALEKQCQVEVLVAPKPQTLVDRVDEFDYVVCSLGAVAEWGLGVARLHGEVCRSLLGGWMRLGVDVVFISHFHPFVHEAFEPLMDCVINTFHSVPATGERLVRGLTGELPFTGKF